MVSLLRPLPLMVLLVLLAAPPSGLGQKFYADDPIAAMPKPLSIEPPQDRNSHVLYDFIWNSVRPHPRPAKPAQGVNTLGEVPDSEWFTNRHGRERLTRDQLRQGPGSDQPPLPPCVVLGAKTEGITPGFRMKDAAGRLYFVKADPASNPEMATAADVIGSRFLHAAGYNTPQNYIVRLQRSQLSVSPNATLEVSGIRRRMTEKDLDIVLGQTRKRSDGSYRLLASLALEGEVIGSFSYEGTRWDDPNDTVSHEDRRDLRGLHVLCAWLNHTDAKSGNTLDVFVEENGLSFVRHFLIDFGAILGSDSDMPKNARFGHEYIFPAPGKAWKAMFSLGLYSPRWERIDYPGMKAVGRFEAEVFDPETWKSNYPNPAFLSRLPDDEYWAAKTVMAFTDEDIRTIVETGEYTDPEVVNYITEALVARRDKIGRTYFSKVLPLDDFRVSSGHLHFEDLAVKFGFTPPREYEISWFRFNNESETESSVLASSTTRLPAEMEQSKPGAYFGARIRARGAAQRTVTVYLRCEQPTARVIGIERTW
ncbi:MAG: hypothetical protein AB1898_22810 [Acidobacteriota bacterium]